MSLQASLKPRLDGHKPLTDLLAGPIYFGLRPPQEEDGEFVPDRLPSLAIGDLGEAETIRTSSGRHTTQELRLLIHAADLPRCQAIERALVDRLERADFPGDRLYVANCQFEGRTEERLENGTWRTELVLRVMASQT